MQRISIASVRQTFRLEKAARVRRIALLAVCGSAFCTGLVAHAVTMGTASGYALISGTATTSTGATKITGDVGYGTAFTRGDAVVNGVIHAINDADTIKARDDARSAYTTIAALDYTENLTGQDLGGGRVLTPGVYFFSSSALLTGKLTLDGRGQTNPEFIFQIGSTLTTDSSYSEIYAFNGAVDWNVFFQVGSSATLGTGTKFIGTILAETSITLNTGATVNGGLFAHTGAVTLDSNTIGAVPEPASAALVVAGLALIATFRKRCKPKTAVDAASPRVSLTEL
ncbi:MAG: ice-binding family protein [bacterium]